MKIAIVLCISFFLIQSVVSQNVYNYSVPKIEGGNQLLSSYQGKRILVATLPISQSAAADSFLISLDTLATAHIANLKVVAVPSYEDGYDTLQKNLLTQWYRSKLGNEIIITDGLYTRKTSGLQQEPLFKWLTDISLNESFDIDVAGPNYKFFIKENGQLYGVIESLTKISSVAVNKTLNLQ